MKTTFIALATLVVRFGLGVAAVNLLSFNNASWSQQREMQGCWSSGTARLLIRQGDRKLRFLEAQVGDGGTWVRLDTRTEGDEVVASTRSGASGTLRLPPDADQLVSAGFANLPNSKWVRCETVRTD